MPTGPGRLIGLKQPPLIAAGRSIGHPKGIVTFSGRTCSAQVHERSKTNHTLVATR